MKRLSICVSEKLKNELKKRAKKANQSMSEVAREIIERYFRETK